MGEARGIDVETPRLLLRRPALADVPVLFEFLGEAQAMRHTHVHGSARECRRRIAVHEFMRRRNDYAPWTIVTRNDGAIVGWGWLYQDPFDPGWGVEVGYFFHPGVWGRGYATELLATCADVADRVLELPEVIAFAHPENAGSRRVLEKTGFTVSRFVPDMQRLLYRRGRRSHPSAT